MIAVGTMALATRDAGEFQLRFRRKSATANHERLALAALSRAGNPENGRKVFLDVEKSLVRDVVTDANGGFGRGIMANRAKGSPGTLTVRGSLVERVHHAGIITLASPASFVLPLPSRT